MRKIFLTILMLLFCNTAKAIPFELEGLATNTSGTTHFFSMPGLENNRDFHFVTVKFKTTGVLPKVIQSVIGGHSWIETFSNSSIAKKGFEPVELGFSTDDPRKAYSFQYGVISDESYRTNDFDYSILLRVDMATYRKATFYAGLERKECYSPTDDPNCAGIWKSTRRYSVIHSNCNKYSTDVLKYAGIIPDRLFDTAVTALGLKSDMLSHYMKYYN